MAFSTVISSGASASGTEAVSSPRFRYGPYLPGFTTMSSPLASGPMGQSLMERRRSMAWLMLGLGEPGRPPLMMTEASSRAARAWSASSSSL